MLRFPLFGFPITVHWMFWVMMVLLGHPEQANSRHGVRALLGWVAAGFVSIIIHELGHAFAMRRFGSHRVSILLYGFGGLAQGDRWSSRTESIITSAAGPVPQLILGLLLQWLLKDWHPANSFLLGFKHSFIYISIWWALLNLLPIIPLDGGRICRAILEDRQRLALQISMVFAVGVGLYGLSHGSVFMMLMFGMLALNNWKELQGEPQIPWMGHQ